MGPDVVGLAKIFNCFFGHPSIKFGLPDCRAIACVERSKQLELPVRMIGTNQPGRFRKLPHAFVAQEPADEQEPDAVGRRRGGKI